MATYLSRNHISTGQHKDGDILVGVKPTKISETTYFYAPSQKIIYKVIFPLSNIKITDKFLKIYARLVQRYNYVYDVRQLCDDPKAVQSKWNYDVIVQYSEEKISIYSLDLKNAYPNALLQIIRDKYFSKLFYKAVKEIVRPNRGKIKSKQAKVMLVGMLTKPQDIFIIEGKTYVVQRKRPLWNKITNSVLQKIENITKEIGIYENTVAFYVDCAYITHDGYKKIVNQQKELFRKHKIRIKDTINMHILPNYVALSGKGEFFREERHKFTKVHKKTKIIEISLKYGGLAIEDDIIQYEERIANILRENNIYSKENFEKAMYKFSYNYRQIFYMYNTLDIIDNPEKYYNHVLAVVKFLRVKDLEMFIIPDISIIKDELLKKAREILGFKDNEHNFGVYKKIDNIADIIQYASNTNDTTIRYIVDRYQALDIIHNKIKALKQAIGTPITLDDIMIDNMPEINKDDVIIKTRNHDELHIIASWYNLSHVIKNICKEDNKHKSECFVLQDIGNGKVECFIKYDNHTKYPFPKWGMTIWEVIEKRNAVGL